MYNQKNNVNFYLKIYSKIILVVICLFVHKILTAINGMLFNIFLKKVFNFRIRVK